MTTDEVIEITHKGRTYCCRWAKKHEVKRVLIGSIWAYDWTEEEVKQLGVKGECKNIKRS